eukprot:TRINITY_DN3355_c1_g4_i1.p1 TRINITY_DN3355_c1_g4~~TRINITY_DN3355_c1_g4_i1.p1  ORF type:complete len:153 (+),score=33.22 TRINITY_DN3355_c1_g4_i1:62-520(+)
MDGIKLAKATKLCVKGSIVFFMTGLLSGVWKYRQMMSSSAGRANHYVDVAHRSSLMYANASVLLAMCSQLSVYPSSVNEKAAKATLTFFGLAIGSYLLHGLQNDTNNQIRQSKNKEPGAVPVWLLEAFMAALVVCEVGGSAVLGLGAWKAIS